MPLTKMEHYLVLTSDIEATKDFYCDALGMRVGMRPPLAFPGYWLYLGEIPCIHIAEWETYAAHSREQGIPVSKRASGTGPLDHIAFNAENFDEVLARLERHGVRPGRNVVAGTPLRQVFLTDPNGVKIEINIRTAQERESRDQLITLTRDIERMLGDVGGSATRRVDPGPRLEALAVRFEADHPALAQVLRQLVDALAKAGI
jgi:catechol 2,3-dioxygenase-like lactoylglutathione lyase family enzyme